MTRRIEKLGIAPWMRQEVRGALKLAPWALASLLLAAALWRIDLAAASGLFQSPPTETPTSEPATPTVAATATQPPTVAPTATVTPTVTAEPTSPPTATPATPTTAPQIVTPAPALTSAAGEPTATEDERQRYVEGESGFRYEWGMLFDSVALGISYLWLCCGILTLLGIPVLFFVLWVASKRRRRRQE